MVLARWRAISRVNSFMEEVLMAQGSLVIRQSSRLCLSLTTYIPERNMYLAEDRILCFEIVTKKREAWVWVVAFHIGLIRFDQRIDRLRYVKSAKASTDVPTTVPEFISQRRRWLNGSLFAAIHATVFWFRIWTSGQNFFRKIFLNIEFLYNAIQLFFTWTSLANFFLAFFFVSIAQFYYPLFTERAISWSSQRPRTVRRTHLISWAWVPEQKSLR